MHYSLIYYFATGILYYRYDFIPISNSVLDGTNGFKYVKNRYTSIGQDGIRFNQSLVSPVNFSKPLDIIDALFNFSDHLLEWGAVSPEYPLHQAG